MIYFYRKNETPKSKNKINVNLLKCVHKEDFVKELGNKLCGQSSPKLQTGLSLDALADVVSDYFIENWLKWHDIYIEGWGYFSNKEPIFSQKVLIILTDSYLSSVHGEIKMMLRGKSSFTNEDILSVLTEKMPSIYLILD